MLDNLRRVCYYTLRKGKENPKHQKGKKMPMFVKMLCAFSPVLSWCFLLFVLFHEDEIHEWRDKRRERREEKRKERG